MLTAAFTNDLALLKTASAEGLRCCDGASRTPLHYAAAGDHDECVEWLLAGTPALADLRDAEGAGALHTAAVFGARKSLAALVAHGGAVDARDARGRTPLHLAAATGQTDTVQWLLERRADVAAADAAGRTALHYAAQAASAELLALLLLRSPELHLVPDAEGVFPLHVACLSAASKCVELLMDKHADKMPCDASGASALHYAAAGGSQQLVNVVLAQGANPLAIDSSGNTALHFAARNGHAAIVKLLLEKVGAAGAVMPNISGDMPAHLAAYSGHTEALKLLEQHFPKSVAGIDTLLHKAAFSGHAECVKYLLSLPGDKAARVNAAGSYGATVLHKAATGGSEECIRLLLDAGANVQVRDEEGALPIHKACFGGHTEAVALLYEKMGNPAEPLLDTRKNSALHMAAASGDAACLAFCLAHWKDSESGDGFFCAHYAALKGDASVVETLHTANAALLEKVTRDGRTVAEVAQGNAAFEAALEKLESNSNAALVGGVPSSAAPKAAPRSLPNDTLNRAVALFNAKPKKGVEFIIQQKLIPDDQPDSIAKFLFETEALSKKKIGELITESDEWSQSLANGFLRQLDFAGKDFDAAIRLFLTKFMLPGEAQKIDRVMEMFASRFHEQNPDSIFANADTCYVLAFAVIMLNTDLFNPSIKKEKKMSKQQWVAHVRGINDGKDLPLDFVHDTYERIRQQEIKMESETNMFANAGKKGFCMKQGGKIRTWKKRYFILSDHQLFYFRNVTDEGPLGIIPLENLTVSRDDKAVKHGFRLVSTDGDIIKSVRMTKGGAPKPGNHTYYIVGAASAEEQEEWIDALNQAIHRSPFYNLLLAKKSSAPKE